MGKIYMSDIFVLSKSYLHVKDAIKKTQIRKIKLINLKEKRLKKFMQNSAILARDNKKRNSINTA